MAQASVWPIVALAAVIGTIAWFTRSKTKFVLGQRVALRANPGQQGTVTGVIPQIGGGFAYEVAFDNGTISVVPESDLVAI
jgi:hypothetical protein